MIAFNVENVFSFSHVDHENLFLIKSKIVIMNLIKKITFKSRKRRKTCTLFVVYVGFKFSFHRVPC